MTALHLSLLTTVFLIPLITPFQSYGFEHSKILFFIFLNSLSGLFWMGRRFKWSGISKASGIFILILLITSLTGVDPKTSLLGADPYFQGWVLYAYLFLFSLMVASSKIKFEYWAYALISSSTLVGILAIKDWLLINLFEQYLPTYAGRVVSTFGQPNFYAGFILLTLPFFYFLLVKKPVRWWIVIGFLISIVAIILSQSRTTYLILSALMILGLMKELVRKRWLILTLILGTIILAIFSSIFLSSGILWKEIIAPKLTTNPDLTKSAVENRVYIWPLSWQLLLQKPFSGYGLENISTAFSNYFEKNKHALFEENLQVNPVLLSLKELNIDRTHSYILDLLLFCGVIGAVVWIGLIWLLFKKANNNVLLVSLITYLVWIQFQNQSIVHLVYFWLLVGIIDQD